jgi:hypothetical protein
MPEHCLSRCEGKNPKTKEKGAHRLVSTALLRKSAPAPADRTSQYLPDLHYFRVGCTVVVTLFISVYAVELCRQTSIIVVVAALLHVKPAGTPGDLDDLLNTCGAWSTK